MNINVKHEEDNVKALFVGGVGHKRLWLYDDSLWYRTVSNFCPHLRLGAGECTDCSLVLEMEEE